MGVIVRIGVSACLPRMVSIKGAYASAQRLHGLVVLSHVHYKARRIDFRHRARQFRLAQPVPRKTEIDEIGVQHPPQNGLVTHAGPAGASALRDRGAVKDQRLRDGERFRALDARIRIDADAQNLHAHVERQVQRDFSIGARLVFVIRVLFCNAGFGIFVGGSRSAIHAISVQVHAGLPECVHVPAVRRPRILEANRQRRGVRAKPDTPAAGRLRQVPYRLSISVLELHRQTKKLAAVLAEPGEPIHFHRRSGEWNPAERRRLRRSSEAATQKGKCQMAS